MACFTNHAKRIHGEFYNGISTTLDDEDSFELVIVELNQREFKHSYVCDKDREMGKFSKKVEIKYRSLFEDKVLENLVAGTKAADVVVARDHYKAGVSGVRDLMKKFPRGYKRNITNTSVGRKKIFHHMALSEKLNLDFFE